MPAELMAMPKRERKDASETAREREIWAYWGGLIRHARQARHLTLRRLATLVDMQPSRLSMLERGLSGTSLDKLERLAIVLNLDFVAFPGRPLARDVALLQTSPVAVRERIASLLEVVHLQQACPPAVGSS